MRGKRGIAAGAAIVLLCTLLAACSGNSQNEGASSAPSGGRARPPTAD
ncbi:hypothetical protein [Cohnella cellulosilytica]